MPTHGSVINLINGFLKEASNLDLAGDAKSTHPSANVDDKTKPATEGARSSENEADVKKDVPNSINNPDTANTDSKGPNPGATINGDQGMVTMDADSGLKGNVDTPKKDHSQSMADSGPGDGGETFKGDWDKASAAGSLVGEANALLADIAMLSGRHVQPQAYVQKTAAASGQAADVDGVAELFKQAADQYPEDVEAGYTAAALLAQQMGLMKEASDGVADEDILAVDEVIKSASSDAQNYVDFLMGYAEQMQKQANPMAAMGGADPAALAALAGEGDAGGEAGEEEMAAGAEDEDAGAALEGLGEGEMEEGEGEEEGGNEDEIEAIAELLAEQGIEPEELAEAVAQQSEGGEEADEAAPEVG